MWLPVGREGETNCCQREQSEHWHQAQRQHWLSHRARWRQVAELPGGKRGILSRPFRVDPPGT
eukprot:2219068-Rhodomonas_salina.1